MSLTILHVLLLTVGGLTGSVSGQTTSPCLESRRSADLPACLSAIGSRAEDTSAFWFGSDFNQNCPLGPQPDVLECYLAPGLQAPQTISSMMFTPGTFDPSTLDRYLDITYTSPPGTYMGCNNLYRFDDTTTFTLDPLSSERHECWTARKIPEMTWPSAPGQLFSLVVYDVGYGFIHGIYVNILGNDIDNSEVIRAYSGPKSVAKHGNVYAFVLFAQTGRVVVDQRFINRFPGQPFNTSDFKVVHNLSGPVAMNWILARADPYSVEFQRSMRISDNCPRFISEAALRQNRPWLQDAHNLDVNVNVTYDSRTIGFISCCQSFQHYGEMVSLNPLGDGEFKAVVARDRPVRVDLTISKIGFDPNTDFAGKMYTLVMVDPDVPIASVGTNETPLLHWLIINIPGGMVDNGEEVAVYLGPSPPDRKPHSYYFLLYEQQGLVSRESYQQYADICSGRLMYRCLFDVSGFASGNGLRIVGASWFVSRQDEFVRYAQTERGSPEGEVCREVPGYMDGCPMISGCWRSSTSFLSVVVVVSLLSCLWKVMN